VVENQQKEDLDLANQPACLPSPQIYLRDKIEIEVKGRAPASERELVEGAWILAYALFLEETA
jgi:hypothetical protein